MKSILLVFMMAIGFMGCSDDMSESAYVKDQKITIESIKSVSSSILNAKIQENSLEIEIKSNNWSGVQAWNSIAIAVFPITKTLFLRNDVNKISYIVWDGDHQFTWARVEVDRAKLPEKWNELTYLEFFSRTQHGSSTLQGNEWLNEFYNEYNSANPINN